MFPQLARFTDVALLFLRIMIGIVFMTSGWKHFQDPEGRSKAIEMSKSFTIFLGAVELAGSLGVILGAIQKKIDAGTARALPDRIELALYGMRFAGALHMRERIEKLAGVRFIRESGAGLPWKSGARSPAGTDRAYRAARR